MLNFANTFAQKRLLKHGQPTSDSDILRESDGKESPHRRICPLIKMHHFQPYSNSPRQPSFLALLKNPHI
jgi:hypothetical protein